MSKVLCVDDLPPPPPGKAGWPWTEGATPLPESMADGRRWPRISVITPSYNQGEFIEQTIRSVLLQGYPNLEYIIIDGGSKDASVSIIKKYERFFTFWVSEPDRGQSHAINKGLARATGQIMCWLNSDDYYLPDALRVVAENLADGSGNYAVVGHCMLVYPDGRTLKMKGRYENLRRLLQFWKGYEMHQPSIFWRREVFERVGFLDENQHYIMDFDYWVRIAKHFDFKNVDQVFSCVHHHAAAKTGDGFKRYHVELKKNVFKYWPSPLSLEYWMLAFSMIKDLYLPSALQRVLNSASYRLNETYKFLHDFRNQ